MTPAVTSANHCTFSLRNPLWNDLDFVPGRVKPRPTFFSYPIRSPPPPEFRDWALKVLHAAADFLPDFVHAHDQHQGDSGIQTNFGHKSTTKTITPRVAQPTSTLTTQPSLHHVKDDRAKDARRHESVRQPFPRNSRASWKTLGRVTQKVNALNYHPIFELSHRRKLRSGCVKLAS